MSKSSKRLTNELKSLTNNPVCGARVVLPDPSNIFKWTIVLPGPSGSPYEKGKFTLAVSFPDNYPFKVPDVKFVTTMYHPNIKKDTGEICMDVFANQWMPTQKVSDIIEKLASLLASPTTDSPLEAEIAQEYIKDRKKFEKNVKEYVAKYAK